MKFQSYEGPKKPVILVTDKFSEGRDLFNANYMIHVDVPQNPLKVEQRIGRIDRMGQQSDTIYVQYVLINQSTEHHQLKILKQRLVQFSTYFGVANSILPDDIGFEGELDPSMVEQIRGNDLESMSQLSIDDKLTRNSENGMHTNSMTHCERNIFSFRFVQSFPISGGECKTTFWCMI